MEALTLKNEATKLIENLPEDKIRYVIQFVQFIARQDSDEKGIHISSFSSISRKSTII